MPQSFAAATAVQRTTATPDPTVPGATATYEATVYDGWDINGNANGGYLLAIAARAISDWLGRPPTTITAHYLAPVPAGDARIEITTVRTGRRFATASAKMFQGDRHILEVLGTFGEPTPGGFEMIDGAPPAMPDFDDPSLIPTPAMLAEMPAIFTNIDTRLANGSGGFRIDQPTGRAEVEGWFGLRTDEPIDALGLLLAADAYPPPIFNLDAPVSWVPTVELTVHIRALPTPGPLRCRFDSRYIADGLLNEDGEVWDGEGRLVCQSRQLALVPRPS